MSAHITQWAHGAVAYTYTDAKDDNDARLVRVPRHHWTLSADIEPLDNVTLSLTANIVRDTLDINDQRLDDYVLVGGKLSYQINDQFTAYLRGVNLLNEQYQTVTGYGTSDLAIYGGVKVLLGNN